MGLQGVQACLKRTILGLFVRFKQGDVTEANEIPIFRSVQTRFCAWVRKICVVAPPFAIAEIIGIFAFPFPW